MLMGLLIAHNWYTCNVQTLICLIFWLNFQIVSIL